MCQSHGRAVAPPSSSLDLTIATARARSPAPVRGGVSLLLLLLLPHASALAVHVQQGGACTCLLWGCRRSLAPSLALPGGASDSQREALSSLLQNAGYSGAPTRVEELSAGFCNWVYLCEYEEAAAESTPERAEVTHACTEAAEVVSAIEATELIDTSAELLDDDDQRVRVRPPMRKRVARTVRTVVAKLFSPLAKLRLTPAMRGAADASASDHGLGPRVLFSSSDGLITDFVRGRTLTESDIHAPRASRGVLRALAPRLAALHSVSLPANPPVVLWHFMAQMLQQIRQSGAALPQGISVEQVEGEVLRMRSRFEELQVLVVNGHGDLKPSNVMQQLPAVPEAEAEVDPSALSTDVTFIDFELAGAHYRGYDLFKLFRTSGQRSRKNMRAFLSEYLRCIKEHKAPERRSPFSRRFRRALAVDELDELQAETLAFEPLTWLEAAVFFFFAMATYPSKAHEWRPLAIDRWKCYLASAHLVDCDGPATRQLLAAREHKQARIARRARRINAAVAA
eukprot:CAMPEP_0119361996 /NCGR_PEP_ID=MMETSP1334-20130426/9186_1 /TAXON_ID=127549 /ORGANISM="Calcidiscus leptoporus, Strain RCC1130" /LENGTH=511 /DNA_ID=CAMNT_0007377147 /DNA_START=84 /DNA_END=1619 /DNA_ORIENTATION=-